VDLDLDVYAGEILGVIGPNGAGKSTTFNMIAGALAPSAGSLEFDGASLLGLPAHAMAARGIMRTFQHNKPFASMSVRENVMVGMHTVFIGSHETTPGRPGSSRTPSGDRTRSGWAGGALLRVLAGSSGAARAERDAVQRADALVEFVGLGEARDADVETLSFGQGRLLEIARALAAQPRLMLFDEPAAGLTPAECERLGAIIRQIAQQGIAVLLIEHDMRFLMALAHRVVVLNFGHKIAQGTPAQILADPAVVSAYLGELGAMVHA